MKCEPFREEGFTGCDFERPVLGRLFEFCRTWFEAGKAEDGTFVSVSHEVLSRISHARDFSQDIYVLVERSDRLSRSNLTSELILQEFRDMGVTVIDCEADLDLTHDDDPSKVLIRQILQAVSEFEKSSIVKKLRRARARKKERDGRCEGAKPYGHYQGEKDVLDLIMGMASRGVRITDIAYHLNRTERIPTRRGGQWNTGTLSKIIKANQTTQAS